MSSNSKLEDNLSNSKLEDNLQGIVNLRTIGSSNSKLEDNLLGES